MASIQVRPAGAGDHADVAALHRGSALLAAAEAVATAAGADRLWLVTTNDNFRALRFYQRRGLRIVAVDPGTVDRARAVKPSIPYLGEDDIPLHDELRLERRLTNEGGLTIPGYSVDGVPVARP
ncbi:GNAT family N-acetyltransferase [Micromonospora fulviviridis]|uniref:GNAT family N-acetyltransferase n=1 Tax=Micromonospora fulviviridis TaxID=47860 RepID=A0ABV2VJX7_9ACTN